MVSVHNARRPKCSPFTMSRKCVFNKLPSILPTLSINTVKAPVARWFCTTVDQHPSLILLADCPLGSVPLHKERQSRRASSTFSPSIKSISTPRVYLSKQEIADSTPVSMNGQCSSWRALAWRWISAALVVLCPKNNILAPLQLWILPTPLLSQRAIRNMSCRSLPVQVRIMVSSSFSGAPTVAPSSAASPSVAPSLVPSPTVASPPVNSSSPVVNPTGTPSPTPALITDSNSQSAPNPGTTAPISTLAPEADLTTDGDDDTRRPTMAGTATVVPSSSDNTDREVSTEEGNGGTVVSVGTGVLQWTVVTGALVMIAAGAISA